MESDKKSRILTELRGGGYVSGEDVCRRLGITRAAVWKLIRQLKEEGYEIEAVRNRGYKLLSSDHVMSREELESRLAGRWAGGSIVFLAETGSTNNDAKRLAVEGAPHGTLVVAEKQNGGRGRRGRGWESPAGDNIFMTLLLRPDFAPARASMLTLVMALAVAEAVREVSGLPARIKWPNDIVLNRKKICGILTEMDTELDYIQYVVIGCGVNVNQETFPEQIADTATSLLLEGNKRISRPLLLERIMAYFEGFYSIFEETGDLTGLKDSYEKYLENLDKKVKVLDPSGEYTGTAAGINTLGELIVERDAQYGGGRTKVYAGEVSVRGVYGYV